LANEANQNGKIEESATGSELPGPPSWPMGYQWPASRLTSAEMMKLTILRNETKMPITMLLREAVDALWNAWQENDKVEKNRRQH
jgi:hypothetical protein